MRRTDAPTVGGRSNDRTGTLDLFGHEAAFLAAAEELRAEVKDFLRRNVPPDWPAPIGWSGDTDGPSERAFQRACIALAMMQAGGAAACVEIRSQDRLVPVDQTHDRRRVAGGGICPGCCVPRCATRGQLRAPSRD